MNCNCGDLLNYHKNAMKDAFPVYYFLLRNIETFITFLYAEIMTTNYHCRSLNVNLVVKKNISSST